MAYTNKTTNYELPQYVSTDKPTYLVDFNEAMRTIDSTMKTNATNIETNATNITVASNKVGDLTTLETTAKTDAVSAINEVNSNIGDLSSLNTTSKSSLVSAVNEVLGKFNLTDITTYRNALDPTITCSNGTLSSIDITVATNSDKSICKIYGLVVNLNNVSGQNTEITIPYDFGVDESFTVFPSGIRLGAYGETTASPNVTCWTQINDNGTITLGFYGLDGGNYCMFNPNLIFVKNFGDLPSNE